MRAIYIFVEYPRPEKNMCFTIASVSMYEYILCNVQILVWFERYEETQEVYLTFLVHIVYTIWLT